MTALQRFNRNNGGTLARPPFAPLAPFSLLDDMLRDFGNVGFARMNDVEESDDAYVVSCDVPGVDPKDIQLSIEGDTLSVRAERKNANSTTVIEHAYTVRGIAPDKIEARCDKGVLTVTLPKAEAAKKRTIPVQAVGLPQGSSGSQEHE